MTTDNTTNTDLYMVDDIQFSEEIEISTTSQIDLNSQMDPCPICLQTPTHPTRLPCSHIFCFLCAKGAVLQNQRCPLCRQIVSYSFFNNPQLLENTGNINVATFEGQYHWYYEGKNGWWLYDVQTSMEIERQYQNKNKFCEVLITGFMYVIDFEKMIQYRKGIPQKARKIKRDQSDQRTKGIAGLRAQLQHHQPAPALPPQSTPATRNVIGS